MQLLLAQFYLIILLHQSSPYDSPHRVEDSVRCSWDRGGVKDLQMRATSETRRESAAEDGVGEIRHIVHSLIISRDVLISKPPILIVLQGCISWYIPRDGLMFREWLYTASSQDVLGCTMYKISLSPRDVPDVPWALPSGHLLVVGNVQPNTSLLSAM